MMTIFSIECWEGGKKNLQAKQVTKLSVWGQNGHGKNKNKKELNTTLLSSQHKDCKKMDMFFFVDGHANGSSEQLACPQAAEK